MGNGHGAAEVGASTGAGPGEERSGGVMWEVGRAGLAKERNAGVVQEVTAAGLTEEHNAGMTRELRRASLAKGHNAGMTREVRTAGLAGECGGRSDAGQYGPEGPAHAELVPWSRHAP
ncbi:hypothetical protein HNP84_001428 [Thermocatellispora tengchongensis]|uniref:Uncharacterized protein n=1 Tax=Thermocatellispora tengchongensis TaxID=1073253 RepID=A0A840P6S6_9ACTN|nr:hypothetical protein [Thermocatellispora tengchongensis]MBB5131715.1 hypothetical protein [Thermocatellispora tengchongensis]